MVPGVDRRAADSHPAAPPPGRPGSHRASASAGHAVDALDAAKEKTHSYLVHPRQPVMQTTLSMLQ